MKVWFDIETDALLEESSKVHSLVVIDESDNVYSCTDSASGYLPIDDGLRLLRDAECCIGHNIMCFDIPVLKKLRTKFVRSSSVLDTLVLSRLIYPDIIKKDFSAKNRAILFANGCAGRHSLKAWGFRLGDYKGDFGATADWKEWSKEMQDYCVQDVIVQKKLYEHLMLQNPDPVAVKLEHDFQELMFWQEQMGLYFDVPKAQELYYSLKKEADALTDQLRQIIPSITKETEFIPKRDNVKKGYEKDKAVTKKKYYDFNPSSHNHILQFLQGKYNYQTTEFTEKGNPKLDRDILDGLEYPEIPLITKYLDANKIVGRLMNKNESGFLNTQKDGRIASKMITNGAVTGRCTHIGISNIPRVSSYKGREFRELFCAGPYWMVGADASQLELRMLAHYLYMYDDGEYMKAVTEGDIHTTNQHAAGLETRDLAKTFIYALCYGAGYQKLGSIVAPSASKEAQIRQGKALKTKFLASIPAYAKLVNAVSLAYKSRGYLKGLDGRVLTVRSEHSALNTLLQSAGAIVMKTATVITWDMLQEEEGWQAINYHDENQIIVVKEKDTESVGRTMVEAIRLAGERYKLKCPLTGEYRIGRNWAETH